MSAALDEMEEGGEPVTLILSKQQAQSPELSAILKRASLLGIPHEEGTLNDLWRMAVGTSPGSEVGLPSGIPAPLGIAHLGLP